MNGKSPLAFAFSRPGEAAKALVGLASTRDRQYQHPRFRGEEFSWYENRCTGCASCAKYCPLGIIEIVTNPAKTHLQDGGKYFLEVFDIDIGRCMFCGLCVEACPYDAAAHGERLRGRALPPSGSCDRQGAAGGGAQASEPLVQAAARDCEGLQPAGRRRGGFGRRSPPREAVDDRPAPKVGAEMTLGQGAEASLLVDVVFWALAALAAGAAFAVVQTRNLFRAALFLIVAFVAVAGLFVLLRAEFIAAVQVLIYVGAISVLIIFAILMTGGGRKRQPGARLPPAGGRSRGAVRGRGDIRNHRYGVANPGYGSAGGRAERGRGGAGSGRLLQHNPVDSADACAGFRSRVRGGVRRLARRHNRGARPHTPKVKPA